MQDSRGQMLPFDTEEASYCAKLDMLDDFTWAF